MRIFFVLSALLFVGGCATRDPVGYGIQQGAAIYPAGVSRSDLAVDGAERITELNDQTPTDGCAAAVIARQTEAGVQRPTAYLFTTAIVFRSSNPMSYGLWGDYIFLDASDRVLYAARRHLD